MRAPVIVLLVPPTKCEPLWASSWMSEGPELEAGMFLPGPGADRIGPSGRGKRRGAVVVLGGS